MVRPSEKNCPRCHSRKMKTWAELTEEQRMLAERLPLSADYTPEERKKHRFCTQCWFEDEDPDLINV